MSELEKIANDVQLICEFDSDWLYLKNVEKTDFGYTDTYKFKDGSISVDSIKKANYGILYGFHYIPNNYQEN